MKNFSLTRRTFSIGLGAAFGLAALPGVALAGDKKVLIIGGSAMGGAMGKFFESKLAEAGMGSKRRTKASSGLARPDFFDWPGEAERLVAAYAPDATIVQFGGNDGQGLWMGKNADPPWIRIHEDGWPAEYGKRVGALADILSPNGEKVFWLGMPKMKSPKLDARVERMNNIFKAQMSVRPCCHFVDVAPVLANDQGKYADHLLVGGKKVRVRAHDGVHLSTSGASLVVEHAVPIVRDTL